MNPPARRKIARWLLLAICAVFVWSARVSALEVSKFRTMSVADQTRYLVLLFEGTRDYLKREGRPDFAKEVYRLFDETPYGDTLPKGLRQLDKDLTSAELYQQKTGKTMHVEYALIVTLKKNGIEVPKAAMMTFAQNFKASGTR